MDERDILVGRYSEAFDLNRNAREVELKLDKYIGILKEFDKKGILSLFLSRKNGTIFRENGITSEETATLSKFAKEAYINIKKASLYDLTNPVEAQKWLNTLAPYLNNFNLDINHFIHSGIPELTNPLESVLEELEKKNYTELKKQVVTDEDREHNKVVNAYNIIRTFDFRTSKKSIIDKQLEIIKPYIEDQEIIELIQNIENYQKTAENIEKYNSMILNQGATDTILSILRDNGYDKQQETSIINHVGPDEIPTSGLTIEQIEHNYVCSMYHTIESYGFLIEPLKEQLDKQEILLNKVMQMNEVQEYLQKMEERTNKSIFRANELSETELDDITKTKTKKMAIPAFIERFITRNSKHTEEEILTADEKAIKQHLEDLSVSNYDVFAYQLRDLKKYINNPDNPLNLSDGTNVIEEIIKKAEKLKLTTEEVTTLTKTNQQYNASLIHYAKNQVDELIEYGCFFTSYCNDIIKQNGINLETFEQEEAINIGEPQLPAIRIDTKEFLESIIKPIEENKETGVKIMKKTIDQNQATIDQSLNISAEPKQPNSDLNNNKSKSVEESSNQNFASTNLNMTDIIKKITQPGIFQSDQENKVIQELWQVKKTTDKETIDKISEEIQNLEPTKTKEILSESWNTFISQFNNNEITEKDEISMQQSVDEENVSEIQTQPKEESMTDTITSNKTSDEMPSIIPTSSILDELVTQNNAILDQTGMDKGIRIFEIQEEIERLTKILEDPANVNTSTLDNGLTLIEMITKSEKKDNANFEEYLENITLQKTEEYKEIVQQTNSLIKTKNSITENITEEFKNNFNERRKARDRIRKRKEPNEEALMLEKECAKTYQEIRTYYEKIRKIVAGGRRTNIETDDSKKVNAEKNVSQTSDLPKLEDIISEVKQLVDKIKENSNYSEKEIANFNKMYELMVLETEIFKNISKSQNAYIELLQIKANQPHSNTKEEIIRGKIKELQMEEQMLSFSPIATRQEIELLMKSSSSQEKISQKLDELLLPIINFNEQKKVTLSKEIEDLESKLANTDNYLDDSKVELDIEKRDSLNELIKQKENRIAELKKIQVNQEELELLESHRAILLNQQVNYEEEKQILLQWNIEESESAQDTREVLEELFKESKENLSSIKIDIEKCENKIKSLENKDLNIEELTEEIAKLVEEKEVLITESEKLTSSIEKKTDLKYTNKEMILSDTEELSRKKQELEKITSNDFSNIKQQFLASYENEKINHINNRIEVKEDPLALPGMLENGQEIKSDGTIIDKEDSPLGSTNNQEVPALPGVLENGDVLKSDWSVYNEELNEEEIDHITTASPSLLEKAKNKLGQAKNKALEWIKKHPKLAAALGAAITVIVIGTTAIIKSISGEPIDKIDDENTLPKDTIEAVNDGVIGALTETEKIVDQAIEDVQEQEVEQTSEQDNTFKDSYESVVSDILEGEKDVYISSTDAINDQNAVGFNSLYKPSFETADVGAIYKVEDGKPVKITLEEAENIVENGGTVSVAVENEEVGIGFVSIGGNDGLKENTTGMSK